jgi:hypothetical protein
LNSISFSLWSSHFILIRIDVKNQLLWFVLFRIDHAWYWISYRTHSNCSMDRWTGKKMHRHIAHFWIMTQSRFLIHISFLFVFFE